MDLAVRIFQNVLRVVVVVNLILGLLFWTNTTASGGLILLHMLLGLLAVVSVWALGALQGFKGGSVGLAFGTFVVGLLLAIIGLFQNSLLALGSAHWVIQVIHLLLAIATIGIGEAAAGRYKRLAAKSSVRVA